MSAEPNRRVFVAVELPDAIRSVVDARAAWARAALGGDIRWVPPENLHVTLAFLGWVPPERIGAIAAGVARAAAASEPFATAVTNLGRFPERGRPAVLWVGLDDRSGAWAALAGRVWEHLAAVAEPPSRPFQPHVTIGRARGGVRRRDALVDVEPAVAFDVGSVALVRSHPGRGGTRYEVLDRWELGARRAEVP